MFGIEKGSDCGALFSLLVDHHRQAHTAIGMTPAAQLSPFVLRTVHQIGPIRERAHERNGEPVAGGLAYTGLASYVVRQMRQRVALGVSALVGNGLIAACERNRLEGAERNSLRIIERELDDAAYLLVVDAVQNGGDWNNFDSRLVQILDRPQLDVEQVANFAVGVGRVANAVELQIGVAQARVRSGLGKFETLREFDAVGGCLHAVIAHLAGITHGIHEMRRDRRLAARELYRHLPLRLN